MSRLLVCLVGFLARLLACLFGWFFSWLLGCLVVWLFGGCSVDWLICWWVGLFMCGPTIDKFAITRFKISGGRQIAIYTS